MEKDRIDFFHSIYLKWIGQSIKPDRSAINLDICEIYCEFLKEHIDYSEIVDYCKSVGENEYTINELKTIWKNVGNSYKIDISILVPAKLENEALEKISSIMRANEMDYKIEKCYLVNNKGEKV